MHGWRCSSVAAARGGRPQGTADVAATERPSQAPGCLTERASGYARANGLSNTEGDEAQHEGPHEGPPWWWPLIQGAVIGGPLLDAA